MQIVYNFEAKSIQHYILESSRLRDMIGASELIEYLCCEDGLLDQVLISLEFSDVKFARRAGGAFQAIFSTEKQARDFQAVWTFCVQRLCPGLGFVQGMGKDESLKVAVEMVDQKIKIDQNWLNPTLPLVGPLVARCPRTGQPAVSRDEELNERLDVITRHKREFHPLEEDALLTKKLTFDPPVDWPRNLEDDIFVNSRFIGIIHADGNNLGQLLSGLKNALFAQPDVYAEVLWQFSKVIEDAVIDAAREATVHVLYKEAEKYQIMPARPLVLGGDDFTFLVRGDLALPFTQHFLEKFEEISQKKLLELKRKYAQLPEQLTACAGIAYIKTSQPFYQGYALAESLCKHAKVVSNEYLGKNNLVPSSVAFHRITTSIIDEYGMILERELKMLDGIQTTMQPYLVGRVIPLKRADKFPHLDDLVRLSEFLEKHEISHGPVREFLSLLGISREQANGVMQRWYDNMKRKQQTVLLAEFNFLLSKLVDTQSSDSLTLIDSQKRTPIGDVLTLINAGK